MLHDITTTSVGVNGTIIPCLHHKDSKDIKKRVKFDAECTSHSSLLSPIAPCRKRLMKAMAAEKTQKERLKGTPRKPKTLERALIGSSSTWRGEELDRFKVGRGGGVMEPKDLIPEKWFEFGSLEYHQSSMTSYQLADFSARSANIHPRG
jgi:hypothetical protein